MAVCLLALSVLLGPAGLGGAMPFAMFQECGADCPCDKETAESGDAVAHKDASAIPHDHSSENECPLNCHDCARSVHAVQAVLVLPVAALMTPPHSSTGLSFPDDETRAGVLDGVFRPPRSLT